MTMGMEKIEEERFADARDAANSALATAGEFSELGYL